MSQVSLPYRIAIVALLVVAALWFVALRPKGDSSDTDQGTAAPGVTGLANDVEKAKQAAGQTTSTPSGTTTSTPSTTPSQSGNGATTPTKNLLDGVGTSDPSRPVLQAVSEGRVAVMLFWNSKGSDDRAVRRTVLRLDTHRGKVLTRVVPVSEVGRYEAITRGAEVQGSPTVVVINSEGQARTINGFTTGAEIEQMVSDLGGKGF